MSLCDGHGKNEREGNIYRERREMLYHYSFTRMVSFHGEGREREREREGREGKGRETLQLYPYS